MLRSCIEGGKSGLREASGGGGVPGAGRAGGRGRVFKAGKEAEEEGGVTYTLSGVSRTKLLSFWKEGVLRPKPGLLGRAGDVANSFCCCFVVVLVVRVREL